MDISEWLKNFVIDSWYKAFISAGAGLFVLSLSIDVKGMSNGQLQLLSGGLFLIGLGAWKNTKVLSWFKPPNVYTGPAGIMSARIRRADPVGLAFEVIGCILIFAFVVAILLGSARKSEQESAPPSGALPHHDAEVTRGVNP